MFAVALKSDTSFAQVLGGGVDFRLMRLLSWRIQADEIETGSPAFERRIFAWPPKWQFDFDVLGTSDGEEPSLCGKIVSFEPQAHEIGTGRRIDCEELD